MNKFEKQLKDVRDMIKANCNNTNNDDILTKVVDLLGLNNVSELPSKIKKLKRQVVVCNQDYVCLDDLALVLDLSVPETINRLISAKIVYNVNDMYLHPTKFGQSLTHTDYNVCDSGKIKSINIYYNIDIQDVLL